MKTLKLSLILTISLFTSTVWNLQADEYDRIYHKTFSAQGAENVDISNKFGEVVIKNWEKNEVSIKVIVTIDARNEEKANAYFDRIQISLAKRAGTISGETKIDHTSGMNDYSIDYEVYMPKALNLKLGNKYGDVFINKLDGHLELDVRYGSIRINELTREDAEPRNKIHLSYSKNCEIKKAGWIKMQLDYSDLTVERSTALIVLSKYSHLYTDITNSLVAESKYDTYRLGKIDKLIINGKYGDYEVARLDNRLEAELKYTDLEVEEVPAGFAEIRIEQSYGDAEIKIAENASYKLEANVQYGDIAYPESNMVQTSESYTSSSHKGFIGSKDARSKVRIELKYGDVSLY